MVACSNPKQARKQLRGCATTAAKRSSAEGSFRSTGAAHAWATFRDKRRTDAGGGLDWIAEDRDHRAETTDSDRLISKAHEGDETQEFLNEVEAVEARNQVQLSNEPHHRNTNFALHQPRTERSLPPARAQALRTGETKMKCQLSNKGSGTTTVWKHLPTFLVA